MSFGFEVTINGVDVALDDSYKNMVRKGREDRSVSAGYNSIDFSNYAEENLIAAIRHKGMGVTFLGYIYSDSKRSGIRLYCNKAGTVELAYYTTFWPIVDTSVGVTIYDENGLQTFHSDHYYLDILKTGKLSDGAIGVGDGFYILSNPETPELTYQPWANSSTTELGRYELIETCTTTQSYEPVTTCGWSQNCSYSYPEGYVCSPGYTCTTIYKWVTKTSCTSAWTWVVYGYQTTQWGGTKCTKKISMIEQATDGTLSKKTITLENDKEVGGWITNSYSTPSQQWMTDLRIALYQVNEIPGSGTIVAPTVVINDT